MERFLTALNYPPGGVPAEDGVFSLSVDGQEVKAWARDGLIYLSRALGPAGGEALARLAGYALGRLLKEEATLAWDPEAGELILWQAVGARADEALLRRFFEVFCTSCDWWQARFAEAANAGSIPEMMIRP